MVSIEDSPKLSTQWVKYCLFLFFFAVSSTYASSGSSSVSSSNHLTQAQKTSASGSSEAHQDSSNTSANSYISNRQKKEISQSSAKDSIVKFPQSNHFFPSVSGPSSTHSSAPPQPTSTNSTTTQIPLRYLWVTWIIQTIGILLTVGTFSWAIYTFRTQSRKSIYDDFWFREIFFKKLSSELIEFRKKWNREKCRSLKRESNKRQLTKNLEKNVKFIIDTNYNLTKEFLADLATLRDLANSIEALAPEAMAEFEDIFDALEGISTSENPEEIHSEVISRVYKHAFSIHEKMRSENYKSLSTLNKQNDGKASKMNS